MRITNLKKLVITATLLSTALNLSACEENGATLTMQKWVASAKTIVCGTASATLFVAGARLSRPSQTQDPSAMGKFFKGANRGAAVLMLGLGAVCAIPAVTSGAEWMNLKYRLWQIKKNR